jgi:serine protease Do
MFRRRLQIPLWVVAVIGCIAVTMGGLAVSRPADDIRPAFSVALPPNQEVGVILADINPQIVTAFGLKQNQGVVVTALDLGSFQPGDVILSLNGQNTGSRRALEMSLSQLSPTETLIFQVSRGGETREVVVQRTGAGSSSDQPVSTAVPTTVAPGFTGVRVENLSRRLPPGFNALPQEGGIVVTQVDKGTPAEAAGLRISDTIVQVNNLPVRTVDQFLSYVQMLTGQNVVLTVMRQGIEIVVVVPSVYSSIY